MAMLSLGAQDRARKFIYQYARPLEQRIYAYYFEEGTGDEVLAALARFQNQDGGFGHGLEADLRLKDSSVLATTVALQRLREFEVPVEHPLVQGAMAYLLATFDADRDVWPLTPPNVDDAPHAPWWSYSEHVVDAWGDYRANPRAEIVGYLYDYAGLVPAALRDRLTDAVIAHLDGKEEMEMHDLACYVRLVETKTLPQGVRDALMSRLTPLVDRTVAKDPATWRGYVLMPLEVVKRPDAAFADLLATSVAQNLDYVIETQGDDGAWRPAWTWGDLYPETWPQAERDWSGVITLNTLTTLKHFGRLEGWR